MKVVSLMLRHCVERGTLLVRCLSLLKQLARVDTLRSNEMDIRRQVSRVVRRIYTIVFERWRLTAITESRKQADKERLAYRALAVLNRLYVKNLVYSMGQIHHYANQIGAEEEEPVSSDSREQANVHIWLVLKKQTMKGKLIAFRRWRERTEQLEWRMDSLQSRQSVDSMFGDITPQSANLLKERAKKPWESRTLRD